MNQKSEMVDKRGSYVDMCHPHTNCSIIGRKVIMFKKKEGRSKNKAPGHSSVGEKIVIM